MEEIKFPLASLGLGRILELYAYRLQGLGFQSLTLPNYAIHQMPSILICVVPLCTPAMGSHPPTGKTRAWKHTVKTFYKLRGCFLTLVTTRGPKGMASISAKVFVGFHIWQLFWVLLDLEVDRWL